MKTLKLTSIVTALVLSNTANAALVSSISNLEIEGTLYDVTFHRSTFSDTSNNFNNIWNYNGDGTFANQAPMFWGDETGAIAASTAIITFLGNDLFTVENDPVGFFADSFLIPFAAHTNSSTFILNHTDSDAVSGSDSPSNSFNPLGIDANSTSITRPYASFSLASPVPVPAAVWLFGSGLLGLIGVARRKKA